MIRQNDNNEWIPVVIGQNEQGRKFGYCSQCGEKMCWQGNYVWLHPQTQGEYTRKYVDQHFFSFDRHTEKIN